MIHERLKEVYDEFDSYCKLNNIDYSIDADYYDVQGYRLLNQKDVKNVLRHMSNFIKNKWVDLEYDGFPVDYNNLKRENFDVPTCNPLFKFVLKPIQEDDFPLTTEDQIKWSNNLHARRQAMFPSSFRKLKTRDTYVTNNTNGDSKKKKKKSAKRNKKMLENKLSFNERLWSSINENVGNISFKSPDILFIKNDNNSDNDDDLSKFKTIITSLLDSESTNLEKYVALLNRCTNDEIQEELELLIEYSTIKIRLLSNLIDRIDQCH